MLKTEGQEGECICPPGISSDAVIAAVDGEADPETLNHLCACPHCAARVERVRALQRRLRHKLYRLQCPTTQVLVDYCQGLLDPHQHALITHHLALCPHCAGEVRILMSADGDGERPTWNGLVSQHSVRPLF
jgi:anti-sigma factor RsiW